MSSTSLLRIGVDVSEEAIAVARTLLSEYAAMPHTEGRWSTATEDVAELPHPFVPPRGAFLVAGKLADAWGCGAVIALDEPGYAEIKRVYVRPTQRGRGVGEMITRALIDEAATLGFHTIRLDTAPELAAAQALYRRLGFRPISHYRDGLYADALCFERAVHV